MELTAEQVRVLGCLLEKEATTPDQYPLSTHAVVTACNQKNNRDPLVSYSEREVDRVMLELRELGLARTVHAANARVPKHKHVLDEAWGLDRHQLAVLAVMMLRGPNTLNELMIRTDRYVTWVGPDAVRSTVRTLQERDPAFAIEIERMPGQRETRFTHLLLGMPAMDTTTRPAPPPDVVGVDPSPPPSSRPDAAPAAGAPAGLAQEVADLRAEVAAVRERLDELARRLGEDI
jgi:uncharacterized protein YceH (UPF0502 family)